MVLNKGGYVIINKALNNVYELAKNALTSGKPILWYETNTECYFIDTATLSGTNIVLTKGGKTITIEADGDITETGNIQVEEKHLYKHYISVAGSNFTIYDTKSTSFTISELIAKLPTDGLLSSNVSSGPGSHYFGNIKKASDSVIAFENWTIQDSDGSITFYSSTAGAFTDVVTQIF